jgi:hypothetical protein
VTAITSLLLTWGTCQTAIPANIAWTSFEKMVQRITEQTSQATRSNKSGFPMMDGVRVGVRVVVGDTEETRQFLPTENVRRRISLPGRFVSICCRSQELRQWVMTVINTFNGLGRSFSEQDDLITVLRTWPQYVKNGTLYISKHPKCSIFSEAEYLGTEVIL